MKIDDFDYDLPPERVAQVPVARRDASRLMRLERHGGALRHGRFADFPQLLRPHDLLVLNDTRVLPARLFGRKSSGGRVELLLLERTGDGPEGESWNCWLKSSRKPALGSRLEFPGGLGAELCGVEGKLWRVRLRSSGPPVNELLARFGRMPLPPYIRRPDDVPAPVDDEERYQTVYAARDGAVAAPTAGLHFTRELLGRIEERGVEIARITLHVGPGTFEPVDAERVEEHRMHAERFELSEPTAAAIRRAREAGGRVLAVGTTVVRTLEHCAAGDGTVVAQSGECDLFIRPGFRFQVVEGMLTNFHLPRSTLIMLVSAFAGRQRVLAAYAEAVRLGYRFYSYGDAMWIC